MKHSKSPFAHHYSHNYNAHSHHHSDDDLSSYHRNGFHDYDGFSINEFDTSFSFFGNPSADAAHYPTHSQHGAASAPPHGECTPETGLAVALTGDAWANGTNTVALGSITNTIKDMGAYTIAYGDAEFTASASSPRHGCGGGHVSADADTSLYVTGADIVIEFSVDQHFRHGNTATATSEIQYVAIDIHDWTPPQGTIVLDSHTSLAAGLCQLPASCGSISGNIAGVIATADAFGPNTTTATATNSLTIENHFSAVAGLAIVAA